jgi:hypothetical protein
LKPQRLHGVFRCFGDSCSNGFTWIHLGFGSAKRFPA